MLVQALKIESVLKNQVDLHEINSIPAEKSSQYRDTNTVLSNGLYIEAVLIKRLNKIESIKQYRGSSSTISSR